MLVVADFPLATLGHALPLKDALSLALHLFAYWLSWVPAQTVVVCSTFIEFRQLKLLTYLGTIADMLLALFPWWTSCLSGIAILWSLARTLGVADLPLSALALA